MHKQESRRTPSSFTSSRSGLSDELQPVPVNKEEQLDQAHLHPEASGPMYHFSQISLHAPVRPAIQTKSTINQPDDPYEQEADAIAEEATQIQGPATAGSTGKSSLADSVMTAGTGEGTTPAPPIVHEALHADGQSLDPTVRSSMEQRFGYSFSRVRIHADERAGLSAQAINALAYTAGEDIVFGAGQYAPSTYTGQKLLAHELTHVIQQDRGHPPDIQRQDTSSPQASSVQPTNTGVPGSSPGTPGDIAIDQIPLSWVHQPGPQDILVAIANHQMLALPAQSQIVSLIIPPDATLGATQPQAPGQPVLAVPTVNKESMKVVNVGGNMGFMVDAGSAPKVVFPAAMNAIRSALGVENITGVAITHIHDDHVRSFLTLIRTEGIRPENIYIPQAFTVNPDTSSSTLAQAVVAMKNDPDLRTLGHGPNAPYKFFTPPTEGEVFQETVEQGDVIFDFYGLSAPMKDLASRRSANQKVSSERADTASLITRATHRPSGLKILFVSDLRGSDLNRFKEGMGEEKFNAMVQGVTVIEGFQHHMGALESKADQEGLIQLIQQVYLTGSGQLSVIAQSQESYGGNQFLNRSLMEALRQLGVNVYIAGAPQGNQAGTVSVSSSGTISAKGTGIEKVMGDEEMQEQVRRLKQLKETEEILTEYYPYLRDEAKQPSLEDVQKARQGLQTALEDFIRTTIENVQAGAAGRKSGTLRDPAKQESALEKVRARFPAEDQISTPTYRDRLEAIKLAGPFVETWTKELEASRTSGRISDKGIEALWELEPERARELVGSSGMPEQEQQRIINQLPGQPLPAPTRVAAGILLVIEIANQLAPVIKAEQQQAYGENVQPGLNDIMWWQSKGVFPKMKGIQRHYFSHNEVTTDPGRVQALINSDDLSYLVLTQIDENNWDNFTIWASTHLKNYRDWNTFITQSNAVRGEGSAIEELRWSYRTADLESAWIGYNIKETWISSPRLTVILQAAAKEVVKNTEEQIGAIAQGPGQDTQPAVSDPSKYRSTSAFADKPKASGQMRFRQGIGEPRLYTLHRQRTCTGYSPDDVFYIFPESASPEPVPSGYVVVGGADYSSYVEIYNTDNEVITESGSMVFPHLCPNQLEILLAKRSDLEEVR